MPFSIDQKMTKQDVEVLQGDADADTLDRLVRELRRTLEDSRVLTPDSEGYAESIRRWSDGVEKRAVRAIHTGGKR